ncbi:MAG: selenium cofactor biosynthesis protein YqeC [Chloroflexota bacterium]|nr:selenium cofactor biosynthesis protein YqeC [Chloroflexota bacterium]
MAQLLDLIEIPVRALVAMVGAGGKTSTMYTLARELAGRGRRVITTTTTNIYLPRQDETDTLIVSPETSRLLKMVNAAWGQHQRITVAGSPIGAGKLAGLQPDQPYELLTKGGADVVIVEADGARHHMLKAPAEHEPVIPPQTTMALGMMSAEALNQPLSAAIVHRPERVSAVVDMEFGEALTPARVARLLMSEQGGMKGVPTGATVYTLVTHVSEERRGAARELARLLQGAGSRVISVLGSERIGEWWLVVDL